MASGFGEHLKREREMRGVSLEEIAGATRISVRFLQALETEAWNVLPGGIFARGFVRTVARYLGLEEENLLAEYSLSRGIVTPPPVPPTPAPLRAAAAPENTSTIKMAVPAAGIVLLIVLIAGGWFGWRWVSARRLEMIAAASALPSSPPAPPAPPAIWQPTIDPIQADPVSLSDTGSSSDLQLRVSATKQTSIAITSDGQQNFAGIMARGETRSIAARASLTVEAQDAGAVQLELNGQTLAPIGAPGQPGKITLGSPTPKDNSGGHD